MRSRRTAVLTAVVLGAVTVLGCGVGSAKTVAPTALVLGGLADRLGEGRRLAHTATYDVTGGEPVTLVRRPPRAAFLTGRGRFVFTADRLISCTADTCRRAPNRTPGPNSAALGQDSAAPALVAEVTGRGFATPEEVLALVAAAALVPGARAQLSSGTIAGQDAQCAAVSGLDSASATGQPALGDFALCVTTEGVLASFRGTLGDGRHAEIKLARLDRTTDEAAFGVPAGARVLDVAALPSG